jgi:hypothetical protein
MKNEHSPRSDSAPPPPPPIQTIPPEAFFDDDFWSLYSRRFTLFAERRIRRHTFWRGKQATDYVTDAFLLLAAGQRRCNACYDRETCVMGVIASLVSHDAERLGNRMTRDLEPSMDAATEFAGIEDILAAREFLEQYKTNFADETVRRYLDLLADGDWSAAEAAEELGVPEAKIWTIRKGLKRPRGRWPGKPPKCDQ